MFLNKKEKYLKQQGGRFDERGRQQQVSGQHHDVLVVTGFQGIRLIVDWNVRKLSEVQRGNAVLLVRL